MQDNNVNQPSDNSNSYKHAIVFDTLLVGSDGQEMWCESEFVYDDESDDYHEALRVVTFYVEEGLAKNLRLVKREEQAWIV